jgi:hypothetical protein
MHSLLCVCWPRSQARSSLQARRKVCAYLTAEGFDTCLRFSGRCDYFKVGGRWSGWLTLLRLEHQEPRAAKSFWKKYKAATTPHEAAGLFREAFPKFRGRPPFRDKVPPLGYPDDAQAMDEPLFRRLRKGFCEEIPYGGDGPVPVIFTTDEYCQDPEGDFPWPKSGDEGERFWVVVIDYHF